MYARTNANASKMRESPAKSATSRGSTHEVRSTVEQVINDIRGRGDEAVREYSKKFDNYVLETFLLSPAQPDEIIARVPKQVIDEVTFVQEQVRVMVQKQLESLTGCEIETLPGAFLGRKNLLTEEVGVYIPGASIRSWRVRT